MRRVGDGTGAGRARWLAQLAQAVDHAQRLAWSLAVSESSAAEVEDLYRRLEAVRIEVEALRRGQWTKAEAEVHPLWTSLFPSINDPD